LASNFYQLLEIGIRATPEEIKSAYKKLALKFHPDLNQGSKLHEEKFKQILEAYQTLSNPAKKDIYDFKLFFKAVQGNSGNSSPNVDPIYRGVPKTKREVEKEEYQRRQPIREKYREFTGPPVKEKLTPHSIAVGLLIISTVVMVFLWFGDVMNHLAAKEQLEAGNYEEAIQFDEEYSDAWYARFSDHKNRSINQKELLRSLNFAIRYADNPPSYWFLQRAFLYYELDSSAKFRSDLLTTKALRPTCDTAFYLLGEWHLNNNQPKVGLAYFDSTLAVNPNNYGARFGKGLSHYRLNQFSKAVYAFGQCLEKQGQDRRCYFYRGASKLGLKDTISACIDLDLSLTMGVDEAKPLIEASCQK